MILLLIFQHLNAFDYIFGDGDEAFHLIEVQGGDGLLVVYVEGDGGCDEVFIERGLDGCDEFPVVVLVEEGLLELYVLLLSFASHPVFLFIMDEIELI